MAVGLQPFFILKNGERKQFQKNNWNGCYKRG